MSDTVTFRIPKDKAHLQWIFDNLPCSQGEFIIPILEKHLSLGNESFQNKMVKYYLDKAKGFENLNNYEIALDQRKKLDIERALKDEKLLEYFKFYHEKFHPTKLTINEKESSKWLDVVWRNIIKDTHTKLTIDDFKQAYHDNLEKKWLDEED